MPDDEETQGWLLWLIVCGASVVTALCFLVFRDWIELEPANAADDTEKEELAYNSM